jgi:hypothetical protein
MSFIDAPRQWVRKLSTMQDFCCRQPGFGLWRPSLMS